MARARRLEARGDPPIAISGCSNFASRSAGVKLRAQLPSRRVAAHNSAQAPAHAERPGGRLHAARAGVEPTGLLGPCGRGAPPPRPLAPARPIRPPGTALALRAVHPRSLPLGRQVTQRLCSTASAHGLGATSVSATRKLSASSQGCKSTAAPACLIPPITLTRALTLALTLALALALALALTPTLARRPLSLAGRATGAEPLRDSHTSVVCRGAPAGVCARRSPAPPRQPAPLGVRALEGVWEDGRRTRCTGVRGGTVPARTRAQAVPGGRLLVLPGVVLLLVDAWRFPKMIMEPPRYPDRCVCLFPK